MTSRSQLGVVVGDSGSSISHAAIAIDRSSNVLPLNGRLPYRPSHSATQKLN